MLETCGQIFWEIYNHCAEVSIFICAHDWANKPEGVLIASNMAREDFLALFNNSYPTDWTLVPNSEANVIELGFLFA